MPQQDSGTFSCEHCGRRFGWKPSIAGKNAKCVCGQVLIVPHDDPDPPEDYGPYALAEVPPVAAIPVEPEPLTYEPQLRDSFSVALAIYPPRDVYAPAGLLVAALIAMLLWATVHLPMSFGSVVRAAVFGGVVTAIKTAMIVGLAFLVAARSGVSFGRTGIAILKFVAIIIVIDAAVLWLDVHMNNSGVWRSARTWGYAILLRLLLAGAIASVLCHHLFQMDRDEARKVAFPLAVLSQLLGSIVSILLGAALIAIYTPRAKPPAAAPAATKPPVVVPTVSPGSPADRALAEYMARSGYIRDARQLTGRGDGVYPWGDVAALAYAAGARNVYIDLQPAMSGQPIRVFVELPPDPARRAACFAAMAAACQGTRHKPAPASMSDTGQRFLTVILGK